MNIKKKLRKLILQEWNIGITVTPIEHILAGKAIQYNWMKHDYKDRWFADPFLLDVTNDDYIILAEDYDENRGYAVLSRLIVDKITFNLKQVKTILDTGTHLSYPYILRRDQQIYVMPENSESGALFLYKMDDDGMLVNKIMVCNEPLTDATLLEYDNRVLLFATKLPNPNSNKLDVYEINNADCSLVDTIEMQGKTARMGGSFFILNNKLYRPAQDCNDCYGGALILQNMSGHIGGWKFDDVVRLTSTHPTLKTGFHTFNLYKDTIVVDVHGYVRHPAFSGFLTYVLNKFRRLR